MLNKFLLVDIATHATAFLTGPHLDQRKDKEVKSPADEELVSQDSDEPQPQTS